MPQPVPFFRRIPVASCIATRVGLFTAATLALPAMAQQGWAAGPSLASVQARLTSQTAQGPTTGPCLPGKFATPTSWTDAITLDDVPVAEPWPLFVQPSDGRIVLAEVRSDPDHPAVVVQGEVGGDDRGVQLSVAFRKRRTHELLNLLRATCTEGANECGSASVDFSGTMTIRTPLTLCGPTIVSTTAVLEAIDAVVAPGYGHDDDVWHGRWSWQVLRHRPDGSTDVVLADDVDLIASPIQDNRIEGHATIELPSGIYEVAATLLSPSVMAATNPADSASERVKLHACESDMIWATQEGSLAIRIRPFDLDGSGEIDMGDLALAMLDFGPCADCGSDLDGSGEVDQGDLALLLLNFGTASCG